MVTVDCEVLSCVREHKDLEAITSHDLKTTMHCGATSAKELRTFWSLHRSIKCFDEEIFRSSYHSNVRPQLEHFVQATGLINDTNSLKRVQRVGTKSVMALSITFLQ